MIKSLLYFAIAGLCEIGGGYLVWLWLRENKSIWFGIVGALILILSIACKALDKVSFD